jgi:hypothetical protein
MRRELGNADEAMAGELGPLAQQKGLALIEQGEQLVAQWNDGEGGGKGLKEEIAEKVHKLKESVIEVVQLARERIAAGKAQKLGEKVGKENKYVNYFGQRLFHWNNGFKKWPIHSSKSEFR